MGLESATFVSQLVSSNPATGDLESQGDDHLRMIKAALQASFPTASKAFYNPSALNKTADFTVLTTQQNTTFFVDTTAGAVVATLPGLASGDAGWECFFIKTNTGTNPLFIQPSAGTIQSGEVAGLSKTRRCIPGRRTRVVWSATSFYAERVETDPIGTVKPNFLSATPVGYEPANGTALASTALYPDYNAAVGSLTVPDCTGRVIAGKEASATRLTIAVAGINGAGLGAAGSSQSVTIAQANLPAANLSSASLTGSVSTTVNVANGSSVWSGGGDGSNVAAGGGATPRNASQANVTAALSSGTVTIGGTVPLGGSGTALSNVQPTIVLPMIIVVE